jgi:hypothetical protein
MEDKVSDTETGEKTPETLDENEDLGRLLPTFFSVFDFLAGLATPSLCLTVRYDSEHYSSSRKVAITITAAILSRHATYFLCLVFHSRYNSSGSPENSQKRLKVFSRLATIIALIVELAHGLATWDKGVATYWVYLAKYWKLIVQGVPLLGIPKFITYVTIGPLVFLAKWIWNWATLPNIGALCLRTLMHVLFGGLWLLFVGPLIGILIIFLWYRVRGIQYNREEHLEGFRNFGQNFSLCIWLFYYLSGLMWIFFVVDLKALGIMAWGNELF